MPIPDFQSLMLPLLEALQDGKERTMREVTASLADRFQLSDAEREELLSSGQQTVFSNRIAWAKSHLKNAGLIDNPKRGIISISELGREEVGKKPALVNCKFLKQFDSYLVFIGQKTGDGDVIEKTVIEGTQTPLELLDASFKTLRKATSEELLSRLKKSSPGFFEKAVVRLLLQMGYGVAGEGQVTGGPGDGGIDGIIREDRLGLDVVCIQAKRWDGSVGRPILQGFVGSMDYHKAKYLFSASSSS